MQDGWTLADGEFLPLPMALAFSDDDEWDEEFEDDDGESLGRRARPPK